MRKIIYILYIVLGSLVLHSCYDDKGNYDYHAINEITVNGFGDTTYQVLYLIDTLHFSINIEGTQDAEISDENYTFRWELGNMIATEKEVIATTRNLELPIDMPPGNYTLYYKVRDNRTGIVVTSSASMSVGLSYTKGYLVLGDREDGTVQLDMVAMVAARQDTSILRDILRDSGLPEMKGAVYVCHTGDSYTNSTGLVKLWVMCESGSYYLDGATLTGSPDQDFNSLYYTSLNVPTDAKPVLEFPRIALGNQMGRVTGGNRGYILSDGSLFYMNTITGEYFGNPLNRLTSTSEELVELYPYAFYGIMSLSGGQFVVYDKTNERFAYIGTAYDKNMNHLKDDYTTIFPWDQKETGRTLIHGDNTRNSLGGSSYGRSYALMKDKEGNYCIYCFYGASYFTYGASYHASAQKGYWEIDKSVATNFDQAERYLFSSVYTYLYYAVGGKVYCYDYGTNRCDVVADFGSDEITWWDVDYWTESAFDRILVATYNSSTGGTLTKFRESEDQNVLTWTETDSKWSGFPKIKSVNWRNSSL